MIGSVCTKRSNNGDIRLVVGGRVSFRFHHAQVTSLYIHFFSMSKCEFEYYKFSVCSTPDMLAASIYMECTVCRVVRVYFMRRVTLSLRHHNVMEIGRKAAGKIRIAPNKVRDAFSPVVRGCANGLC